MDRTGDTARAASELIGYARVSTDQQNLALQLDALYQTGCTRVYKDVGSGSLKHRPQLDACLDYLRAGDTLVVWRLDRLGRGLKHLIDAIEQLPAREIGFRSVTEQIDTTTSGGMLQFHIFGALAEFERQIIRERTRAGLAAARARGRLGGRPPLLTAEKLDAARMMREQKRTMPEIARALGVSRATLYRHLALEQTPGEQRRSNVVAASFEERVFHLGVDELAEQERQVAEIRGRAPALLAAGAVVPSLLAHAVFHGHHPHGLNEVLCTSLGLLGAAVLFVATGMLLWPRELATSRPRTWRSTTTRLEGAADRGG